MYSFWLDETVTPEKRYYEGRAFTYGEGDDKVQYTKAGATPATFASLNFKEVIIDPRPWDDNYYIVSGPDNEGHYNATPRQLDDVTDADGNVSRGLKWGKKEESWRVSEQLLLQSDWWIQYRFESGNTPADPDICKEMEEWRAYVRFCQLTREQMIDATTTVDELKALVEAPEFVYDEDGNASPNPDPHLPSFPPGIDYETACRFGDAIAPADYEAQLVATLSTSKYAAQVSRMQAVATSQPAKRTRKKKGG